MNNRNQGYCFFLLLIFLNGFWKFGFAQKNKWLSFDSSNQKSEIPWAISAYYGWNTRYFTKKPKSEWAYNSTTNLGFDFKRSVSENLFLCLHNRIRFDYYYIEVPDFSTNQVRLLQVYFIHSHAIGIEKRFEFKSFNILVGAAGGVNLMYPAGLGIGYALDQQNINFTYSSSFLDSKMGINGLVMINLGADYALLKDFYAHYNFSLSRDLGGFKPIVPIEIVYQSANQFIKPKPQIWNSWLQLGFTYRF